jgi:hypothetical protein
MENNISQELITKLEKIILCQTVFVGEWVGLKKRVESFFNSDEYKLLDSDAVETLILSYAGGEKLHENRKKDSNYKSSGHIWEHDIYCNIEVAFNHYLKDIEKNAEHFLNFIESFYSRFEKFNRDAGRWHGVDSEQKQFICNMYLVLLSNLKMSFSQKYMILNFVKDMVIKSQWKYYYYNKKLLSVFCDLFPDIITKKEKKKIKDKLVFDLKCIREKNDLLKKVLTEDKVELIKNSILENSIEKPLSS